MRGKLARDKFARDLRSLKDRKSREVRPNTNEYVLQMALKAASKIGLNMEMIFRAADKDHMNLIAVSDFKIFLQNIGFNLTKSQLSRFLFLLDEDCSGIITRDEYYDTLGAYEVNREQHKRGTGRSYDQDCLILYGFYLKQENMEVEQSWNLCDKASKGKITYKEFFTFLDSDFKEQMKDREKYALASLLDYKKMKEIEKVNYCDEVRKAKRITSTLDYQTWLDETRAGSGVPNKEMYLTGSTAFNRIVGGSGAYWGNGSTVDKSCDFPKVSQHSVVVPGSGVSKIVRDIETNTTVPKFLVRLLNTVKPENGKITAKEFEDFLRTKFKVVLDAHQVTELVGMLAKDGKVDVMEVKNLFYENSRKKLTAVEFLFRVLGEKMDEHDTGISLAEYLTKVYNKRTADNYNLVLFSDTFSKIFCASLGESEDLFKYIDTSNNGTVEFGKIEVAINKFRSDIRGEMEAEEQTMKVPAKAPGGRRRSSVNAVIDDQDPGWLAAEKALAKMKVQDEPKAVVEKLREAFKFLEINSTFLYDLADSHQLNSVPVSY